MRRKEKKKYDGNACESEKIEGLEEFGIQL